MMQYTEMIKLNNLTRKWGVYEHSGHPNEKDMENTKQQDGKRNNNVNNCNNRSSENPNQPGKLLQHANVE
jgi:hypothetical protein